MSTTLSLLFLPLALGGPTGSSEVRVAVTFENLAPVQGTFQTPMWVGFHDGGFDSYTGGVPANGPNALVPNDALERLAEDGTTSVIGQEFLNLGFGTVEGTIPGPNGPIAPGDRATLSFLLDPTDAGSRYFSYASMVIPSNDAFIANGNPLAHPLFDAQGGLVFEDFIVAGNEVIDAGTEVNDELPANTAFFGQMAPDTGVDENGVVFDHLGFNPFGSGGILDDFRFTAGDFLAPAYPIGRFTVRAAPAITEDRLYGALLDSSQTVPAVQSGALGRTGFFLENGGTTLRSLVFLRNIDNVTMVHLHLGAAGETGPVVLSLLGPATPGAGAFMTEALELESSQAALAGPLAGFPLDRLIAEMEAGNVYINVHTDDGVGEPGTGPGDFPSGEIRGQLFRIN